MSVVRLRHAAVLALGLMTSTAMAQAPALSIKIGVLSDMSSVYSDIDGSGSVIAAQMAVEDFGAAKKGMKVEIISADHQNKGDVASNKAREWFDTQKVDMMLVASTLGATPPNLGSINVDNYTCYKVKMTPGAPKFPKGLQVSIADTYTSPVLKYRMCTREGCFVQTALENSVVESLARSSGAGAGEAAGAGTGRARPKAAVVMSSVFIP